MSFLLQILLLLTFLLQARPNVVFTEVASPKHVASFSIVETKNLESEVKIDVLCNAISGIEGNAVFQKVVLEERCGLLGTRTHVQGDVTNATIYGAAIIIPGGSAASFKLLKSAYNSGQKQLVKLSAANTAHLVNHVPDIHDTRYIYRIHKDIPDNKIQQLSHAIKNGDAPVSKLNELFTFTGNKSEQLRVIGEVVGGAASDWITFIGKNIDELVEAPIGYQFYNYNGKKFLRRVNASDINTPRLSVSNGKVVKYDGQTIPNLSTNQVVDLAISSTKNPTSLKGIMLGKYDPDLSKVSYNRLAKDDGYTYFEMDNWDEIYKLVNESKDEMWKINEQVIKNQFNSNKPFYFSHNPNDINVVGAGSFYEQEIDLIKQLVQQKYGKTAKFNPSNQYWKLEW